MKLRAKILLTYIALAVVGIVVASLISSWQLNNFLNRRTASQLAAHVQVVSELIVRGDLQFDSLRRDDAELRQIARTLDVRLTLIRKDGTILSDSDVPPDSIRFMENHASRPEVLRSREGGIGTDRRVSASVGQEFLYASRRVFSPAAGELDSGYVRGALNIAEIELLDTQVQTIIWIIGALTVGLIAAASFRLSRTITAPVLAIASTANAIKDGNVRQRVTVETKDEIGDLAKAINEMAEKLGNDIAQLRKLERIRSEFLANVSHELRTPIFSVQGFIETLLDGAIDDPSVNRDFLEKAHRHASRLNALLNDLIEISRIESGEMKMSFRYFSVVEFLNSMIEEMRPVAERKGIRLSLVESVGEEERVFGDRDRLRQVMVNLLDNAVKYTDRGGSITCSVERDGPLCAIRVSDTGQGIAPEHHARVFERFYRVDKDRSRDVGGTGLGLAIVKHIVEAHGGSISVSSTVGKGSVFTFTLKR
jgi:two-component system, OmpR family, phosphate regulon sensor histidine kinase PhoR